MALKVNFRWLSFLGGGLRNWNSGEELNFYEGLFQFPPRPLGHLIVSWHKRALNCSQQFKNLSSSEWSWCLLTVAQVLLGKRRNSCIANLFVFCSRLQLSNECCTCAEPKQCSAASHPLQHCSNSLLHDELLAPTTRVIKSGRGECWSSHVLQCFKPLL